MIGQLLTLTGTAILSAFGLYVHFRVRNSVREDINSMPDDDDDSVSDQP